MINLSLNELKLIAQGRNVSDYKNKSDKDLIKLLSEPKSKNRINKKKLKELRKDFDELRHKFFKTDKKEYRKAFYDIKNYRNLSESEIKKVNKKFNKFKKKFKV